MNTYVRDNTAFLGSTAAAVLAATGSMFTSGASFVDLISGGAGPTVTAVTGAKALVIIQANMTSNVAGDTCSVGYDISGATTIPADVGRCLSSSSAAPFQGAAGIVQTGLTAGTNTFTAKYNANAASATFANRGLIIVPLP